MKQELYKVTTAMQRLNVCRSTIYRMAQRGDLELVKFGRVTRVTGASIDRLINAQMPSATLGDTTETPSRPAKKGGAVTAAPASSSRRDLEQRVAALERDAAKLRKLISKLKEMINE